MRSLRARLVAAALVLATVGMVLVGAVTYAGQRSFLYDRLDDQAHEAIGAVGFALAQRGVGHAGRRDDHDSDGDGPPRGGGPGTGLPPGTYGQRRDADGTVLGDVVLDFDRKTTAAPHLPEQVPVNRVVTIDGYRVFADRSSDGGLTIAAVPLTDVDETLQRLLVVEALVILAVLAALAAVTWLVVRLGLLPLDRMTHTAGRIAGGDLSHRVEDADPRSEIGRLGLAFNRMLDRLEEAFRERERSEERLRRFLADASHELRTPLTSIRGYAELHRMGAAGDTTLAMRRIEEEATRMGTLVEDLLALARLDEVADQPHAALDLRPLLDDAAADARASAPDREIRVRGAASATVRGDTDQLRQVLANLVRNALVHTPAGSAVELALDAGAGTATIAVRDHGPGLPTDDPAALFGRFWRAEGGRERGQAGAGLGLAIVAAIADAHGGTVRAENAAGGGARFTVTLPLTA
jgi:two-component system OmpR family sensor kinase